MFALLLQAHEAAEAAEPSKAPFYIAAGVLVLYAAVLSVVGTLRHETFPPTRGISAAIMGLGVVLVACTMATSVITG
jgi:hypothetical protein